VSVSQVAAGQDMLPPVRTGIEHQSIYRRAWRQIRLNPLALLGLLVLALLSFVSVSAPFLPLQDPNAVQPAARLLPPLSPLSLAGTDDLGRDMLSRLLWGGRISLVAGIGTMLVAAVVGVIVGLIAGYFGGWVDNLCMRTTDVIMAFPAVLLAIAIVAALGPGLVNTMVAVAIVGFPLYARMVRSVVLSLKEKEYVEAARALGASGYRIMVSHLLPNALGPIIVAASLDVGSKIIITASMSFLGLGTQPPTADWGSMLATGRNFITVAPHMAALPGLFILLTVLGFNLLGDALRDALDPRFVRSVK